VAATFLVYSIRKPPKSGLEGWGIIKKGDFGSIFWSLSNTLAELVMIMINDAFLQPYCTFDFN
jgi:hypothetical protein